MNLGANIEYLAELELKGFEVISFEFVLGLISVFVSLRGIFTRGGPDGPSVLCLADRKDNSGNGKLLAKLGITSRTMETLKVS